METKEKLIEWAKQYDVHIVGGSIAKQTEQGVTNTMYVVNNEGQSSQRISSYGMNINI